MDIDRQDLAEMAAVAFQPVNGTDDIPEKIWVDAYHEVAYVRAAWAGGINADRIDRLQILQRLLAKSYDLEVVAVAYWQDMPWSEIDARAAALREVQ